MLDVVALCSGALLLCWTRLCVAQQVSHSQQLIPAHGPTLTGHTFPSTKTSSASTVPQNAPCFVDDIFTVLREGVGDSGELTNSTLASFGICPSSDNSSGSALLELAVEIRRNQGKGPEVLLPAAELAIEEDERGMLTLVFDLPQSPLFKLNPVLLLAFESPPSGGDLGVAFTSHSLQPNSQSVCISGETQYLLLTGKSSEGNADQKWRISAETKSPDMRQNLKDVLIGGKSGSDMHMIPLLLFSGETGTDIRHLSSSSPASSQTPFLCELKRFLRAALPQEHPESPLLQLDSLQSLPPLSLGPASSETFLAGMINSSAPIIFSFASWGSMYPVNHGELSLSSALLEELRQRLEQYVGQIMEDDLPHRATERLEKLKELSSLQRTDQVAGKTQYCAFLLLKALQTVSHRYNVQRGLRATRAGPDTAARNTVCGLKSLTVSFEKLLLSPHTANIYNCHGSCTFPLANANNHAVLLNFHIESHTVDERAPCCVPVAYNALEVVDFNEHGTYLSIKPDVIAKECGCR